MIFRFFVYVFLLIFLFIYCFLCIFAAYLRHNVSYDNMRLIHKIQLQKYKNL